MFAGSGCGESPEAYSQKAAGCCGFTLWPTINWHSPYDQNGWTPDRKESKAKDGRRT